MKVLGFLVVLCLFVENAKSAGDDDKVAGLPGTTFKVNFDQYSGYLNAGNGGKWKFFYWLVESQTGNSANDPLIVWFNGGPGCSSLGGLFEELGPFYVNSDRKTLYENIYSWNKYANVLAIESPIGVGFSYNTDDPNNYTVGDDQTAQQNHDALADFFANIQPRYKNRQWFIAGESYAGIYIPTVTQKIFQSIVNGNFPNPNFTGIAIGNGYMNIKALTNALVIWTSYHGLIGLPQWRDLKQTCCQPGTDVDSCDFAANFNYVYMNDTKNNACANKVIAALSLDEDYTDPYNFYQDCYSQNQQKQTRAHLQRGLLRRQPQSSNISPQSQSDQQANKIYYDSSDNQFGYPCDNGDRARAYFRQPEVLKAFHIDDAWINAKLNWSGCNMPLNENYPVTYNDTTDVFYNIIKIATDPKQYVKNFRILIYNGDVDTVCNFLGDSWHIDNIASHMNLTTLNRIPWVFRNQYAGYHQPYYTSYSNGANNFTLDVLTVKGSGHFVPNDKQGPSLQMITNFIRGSSNYNSTNNFQVLPSPQPGVNVDGTSTSAGTQTPITSAATQTPINFSSYSNPSTSSATQTPTTSSNSNPLTLNLFTVIVALVSFLNAY